MTRPQTVVAATRRPRPGAFLILLGGASLLTGLDAALLLLGLPAPVTSVSLADAHGPLMVFGFLGTLIAVERAQALRQAWGWLAPVCLGGGALVIASGLGSPWLGWLLLLDGALLLLAVYLGLWRRAPLPLVAVQALSAVLLAAAAGLAPLLGIPAVLSALTAFLVLTIASERAELTPLGLRPAAMLGWLGLAGWLAVTAAEALVWPGWAGASSGSGCSPRRRGCCTPTRPVASCDAPTARAGSRLRPCWRATCGWVYPVWSGRRGGRGLREGMTWRYTARFSGSASPW